MADYIIGDQSIPTVLNGSQSLVQQLDPSLNKLMNYISFWLNNEFLNAWNQQMTSLSLPSYINGLCPLSSISYIPFELISTTQVLQFPITNIIRQSSNWGWKTVHKGYNIENFIFSWVPPVTNSLQAQAAFVTFSNAIGNSLPTLFRLNYILNTDGSKNGPYWSNSDIQCGAIKWGLLQIGNSSSAQVCSALTCSITVNNYDMKQNIEDVTMLSGTDLNIISETNSVLDSYEVDLTVQNPNP